MGWVIGQSLLNGLMTGGVYALIAVGLTIIFGVMKIVNFAHGEFLMIGMYGTWLLFSALGSDPYLLIVPVAFITFFFGWLIYKTLVSPIMGKDDTSYILLTVGLSFFLQSIAQLIWSADYQTVESSIKNSAIQIGEFSILLPRFISFIVAIGLVIAIEQFLERTDTGRAMRAAADNNEVATLLGVNVATTYAIAFALGSALAGVAGVLLTPMFYIYPRIGTLFNTTSFIIVVLGGLGNVRGALIGGLLIGLVEAFIGSTVALDLAPVGTFVIFLLVLFFKPDGLFGKGGRKA